MITVSWVRAYHTRRHVRADEILERLDEAGLVRCQDDDGAAFYDIQSLRSSHFASAVGPAARLVTDLSERGHLRLRSAVLAHASGFLVLRLTANSVDNPEMSAWGPAQLRACERLPWDDVDMRWELFGHSVRGNVRHGLNLLFLVLHEELMGREPLRADLAERAVDGPHGNAYLQELCHRGESSHPLPVSFGTHIEVADTWWKDNPIERVAFVREVLAGAALGDDWLLQEVEPGSTSSSWYVHENQSVLFTSPGPIGDLAVVDADRTQLLEFLTLRRGALRSIQRDTQRVLTGGNTVSRRRIDEWRLLLATTTDDYVLHDRISRILVPLQRHLRESGHLRDPDRLEAQVRRNIDSFQARIELASQSVSTVIGALFAVVAAVLGIGTVAKAAAAERTGVPVSRLTDVHPWLVSAIDVGVTLLAFIVTWQIIKRAAARVPALRPYGTGRLRKPPRRSRAEQAEMRLSRQVPTAEEGAPVGS